MFIFYCYRSDRQHQTLMCFHHTRGFFFVFFVFHLSKHHRGFTMTLTLGMTVFNKTCILLHDVYELGIIFTSV